MAKTNTASQSLLVSFALVFWLKPKNERSEYEDTSVLKNSLAERGWFENNVIAVTPIQRDEDLTKEDREKGKKSELALCMEEREMRWEALKKAANDPEKASELAVFEHLFVKNGKIVAPKYAGNAGFRRASVFEQAMLLRFKNEAIPAEEKIPDLIPVRVKTYANEAERIIDQQLENELQGVGTAKVPDLDKLKIAQKLFNLGVREVHLRKLYTDTTGQKLFGICQANHNWPQLRIYDRLRLPEGDSAHIPYGPVRHNVLVKFNNRFEADQKRKEGRPLKPNERALAPITQEDVANYFNECASGGGGGDPQKIMGKKDIEAIAKQNSIGFVKVIMQSVLDNSNKAIAEIMPHADQLNLLKELLDSGKADDAQVALTVAKEYPDVLPLVSDSLETLTKEEFSALLSAAVADKQKALAVKS